MSFIRALVAATVAASAATTFVGCALPPVTLNGAPLTVPYNSFFPDAKSLPVGVPVPAFPDKTVPPTTIPVPPTAHSFKIAAVTLNLSMLNTGGLPLAIKLYLVPGTTADGQVYAGTPLGGGGDASVITLPGRSTTPVMKSFVLDPTLLSGDGMKLGTSFSSPGASNVTFQDSDAVTVQQSVSVSVKPF